MITETVNKNDVHILDEFIFFNFYLTATTKQFKYQTVGRNIFRSVRVTFSERLECPLVQRNPVVLWTIFQYYHSLYVLTPDENVL